MMNKSNIFSKENKNLKNKNLEHYVDDCNDFYYDPNIWEVDKNCVIRYKDKKVKKLPEDLKLPEGCVDISYMFAYCYDLVDISPLKNWDISNVKYMGGLFFGCKNLTNISSLKNWDTSNIEGMNRVFDGCDSIKNYPSWYNK